MRLFKGFCCRHELAYEFDIDEGELPYNIPIAIYERGGYEGEALVIFWKGIVPNLKLYRVDANHCSCCGLEDQWRPEETTYESLKHEATKGYGIVKDHWDKIEPIISQFNREKTHGNHEFAVTVG